MNAPALIEQSLQKIDKMNILRITLSYFKLTSYK